MIRNPMQSILAFAENRGKDADILTNRLNGVFGPLADQLIPASATGGYSLGEPVAAPAVQQGPAPGGPQSSPAPSPPPSFSGVAGAGAGFTNVQLPDGTVQRREGTRAWRNNNPGNIEYGDFAASRGAVGSDGRFAVFPTYEAGREAKASLLFESPSYRDRTISSAINRYAPPSENDTRNYVGQITDALGVSPDTRLSDLSPQQRETMLDAMQRVEGFTPGTVAGVQADDLYHTVGDALGVTLSSSGTTTPEERRTIESDLGAILNEVDDPESQVEANKRQGVADLFTGLGIGFGQMSRGDRVDLSEVRNAAAQRRREQTALRMERAKRAAGASYAMELGDEGMARAIAGGAADVGTMLTKRQQDIVNDRANTAILREAQQSAMLANILSEDGSFSPEMVEAVRAGADVGSVMKLSDRTRAAELAAEAQQRAEDQIEALRAMQQRTAQPDPETGAAAPVDPIVDRAFMNAELDGYRKIYEGGSLYDYMSEARQQVGEMRQQAAANAGPQDSAKEQAIQRALELPDVYTRDQAIKMVDGFLEYDSSGVLRDTSRGGEPVVPPTAGLSTAAEAETVGPPRDETGTSLFNRVGQTTGVVSAGQGLLESTLGQITSDPLFPERAETIQEFNTMRGQLIDAYRNSGRMLSQELALLLEEVAPGSSVFQSPGMLQTKMESIDRELRQRLQEERARANDPGVSTGEREMSSNLAMDIERVLTRLHQPADAAQASAVPPEAPEEAPVAELPEEVRRSPAFRSLQEVAEKNGVTPEEMWPFLSDDAKKRFMSEAE